jgi:hypothetical protein
MHRAGLFAGAAGCDILWPDGALKQMLSGLETRFKAAPLRALGVRPFVLRFFRMSTRTIPSLLQNIPLAQ